MSWLFGSRKTSEPSRTFNVVIYEEDYKELCAWVLKKPDIETGGDLFGLWADKHTAVIQLVLGPGRGCRRTSASFYQDIDYLQRVGSYLKQNEGVCHIGEWHSHHQTGLARPSVGDENTVWNNMPTYNLKRFVIFIANIRSSKQSYNVNIGCFLFETDDRGNRLDVLPGEFRILQNENPLSSKKEVSEKRYHGAEKDDENKITIKDLMLRMKESGKSPQSVTYLKSLTPPSKKRNWEKNNQLQSKAKANDDVEKESHPPEGNQRKPENVSDKETPSSQRQEPRPLPTLGKDTTSVKQTERQPSRPLPRENKPEKAEEKAGENKPEKAEQSSGKGAAKKIDTKESARKGGRPLPKPVEEKTTSKKPGKPLQIKATATKRLDQQSSSKKADPSGTGSKKEAETSILLHSYSMQRRPRGICVIINNVSFLDNTKREGAEVDERELKHLFEELFFTVSVRNDLKWDEMRKVATEFAAKDHSHSDGLVFIVMSHGGDRDVIYGVGGRSIRIEDLMSEFKAANCPTLQSKPKMFFIQTCRGSMKENNLVNTCNTDSCIDAFSSDSTLPKSVCPQEADFLLAFSAAPGYVAWRNHKHGSRFVQALVEVIRKHHSGNHLLDMLTEVNRLVMERGRQADGKQQQIQVPAPVHTLRAKVFL